MRGHRSPFALFALALLLGTAGASSSAHHPPGGTGAAGLEGLGAAATAPYSPLWGEALESSHGRLGLPVDERIGPDDGSRPRPVARSEARRSWNVRRTTGRLPRTARRVPAGARLLGLSAAPANAPPGS